MKAHLREWSLHLDKTQVDLARHIGVTKGEISRLESGYRRMTTEWMSKLADALGIKPEQLIQLPPNYSGSGRSFDITHRPAAPGFPLATTSSDFELMQVSGDEMSPTVMPGDWVLADKTRRAPAPPGLFVCEEAGERTIRRIQTVGGRLRISFDNGVYPPYEAEVGDVEIVGRVTMRLHRL